MTKALNKPVKLNSNFYIKKLKSTFSGEVFFALFLLSGTFKSILVIQNYIDITLLFLLLSFLSASWRFIKRPAIIKGSIQVILPFVLFCLLTLFSLTYTVSSIYSLNKTVTIITLVGWSALAPIFLINKDQELKRFFNVFYIVGIAMSIDAGVRYLRGEFVNTFVTPFKTNYLAFAWILSILSIMTFTKYLISEKSQYIKYLSLIAFMFFTFMIVISGARGPLLLLLLALFMIIFFTIKLYRQHIKVRLWINKILFLLFLLFLFTLFLYQYGYLDLFIKRMVVIFEGLQGKEELYSRFIMVNTSLEMWMENPFFGWGIGSYPVYAYGIDQQAYPHNIFLEIMSELGIFGLVIFMMLLFYAVRNSLLSYKQYKYTNREYLQISFNLVLYYFIFITFFGSIEELSGRLMFTFISLAILSPWRKGNFK